MGITFDKNKQGGLAESPSHVDVTPKPDPVRLELSFPDPTVITTNKLIFQAQPVQLELLSPNATPIIEKDNVYQASPVSFNLLTPVASHKSDSTFQAPAVQLSLLSPAPTPIVDDPDAPDPTVTATENPTNSDPEFEVDFGEVVFGFEETDPLVDGGSLYDFQNVDGQVYSYKVLPDSSEIDVVTSIPAGVCEDNNGKTNNESNEVTVVYDAVGDKPVITSTEDIYSQSNTVPIVVTFPEEQVGFDDTDLTLGNGTVSNFVNNNDGTYSFDFSPTSDGAYTIDISSGKCTDQAGNNNVAADQFVAFHDEAAPTVSNTDLEVDPITDDGGTVGWTRATDLVSDQEDLFYELYSSLSDNITTVQNALDNGVLEGDGTNINTLDITGKTDGDEVWIKVLCYDQAGNILGYTTTSFIVKDGIPPTIVSPTLGTEELLQHSYDVVYAEAEDNITVHANMKYHLYTSEQDNLNSVADAEANGTFQETGTGVTRLTADGLLEDTEYYNQIIAEDEDGNKAVYDALLQKTASFGDAVLSQAQIF